ncbi:MAG: cbb3-type cytochrome c oxidase subunit I [Pyrobaculum sp.]
MSGLLQYIEALSKIPRRMFFASVIWLFVGAFFGPYMVLAQLTRSESPAEYYIAMSLHGLITTFPGLFQFTASLSLLRAGFCNGRRTDTWLEKLLFIFLNLGGLLALSAVVMGVRTSYTLMFPLPAAGLGLMWGRPELTLFVIGVIMLVAAIALVYPASLARLLFFGRSVPDLVLEKSLGNLSPRGMMGMVPAVFILPTVGAPVLLAAASAALFLLGLPAIVQLLEPVNFNYAFWLFAHTLMEVMGVMALGTAYWVISRCTESREAVLYSDTLGRVAILIYTIAAPFAFGHHLYTMSSTQPFGLSVVSQIASWLVGFGAAFSVFNIAATLAKYKAKISPPLLAAYLGFTLYIADGFLAMLLATIGLSFVMHGTYFATAHLMAILLAVFLMWLGDFYRHQSLLLPSKIGDRAAYVHIATTFVAAVGLLYAFSWLGSQSVIRRTYPMAPFAPTDGLLIIAAFGLLLAFSQIYFLVQIIRTVFKRK